jgi:CRP-like cAMP-binding protein
MAERILDRRTFKEGDYIIREGEPSNGAYLVQEGRAEVFTENGDDKKKIHIAYVNKEEVIGEMGLIDSSPRSASVQALEKTVCVFVDKATFENKITTADPFIRALIRILSTRLRRVLASIKTNLPESDEG